MSSNVLSQLEREWAEADASPASAERLAQWATTEPALAGFHTIGEVLRHRWDDESSAQSLLYPLAKLAADGDELAARALLKALTPGIVTLATRLADPGCLEELLSLAWERIRTYPTWRPGAVAGNVLLDVRKRYFAHREIDQPKSVASNGTMPDAPSAEDCALKRSCIEEVVDASHDGVIGPVALQLILRTRLDGLPLVEAAAEMGAGTEWANCVRWRAERRLRPVLAEAG